MSKVHRIPHNGLIHLIQVPCGLLRSPVVPCDVFQVPCGPLRSLAVFIVTRLQKPSQPNFTVVSLSALGALMVSMPTVHGVLPKRSNQTRDIVFVFTDLLIYSFYKSSFKYTIMYFPSANSGVRSFILCYFLTFAIIGSNFCSFILAFTCNCGLAIHKKAVPRHQLYV